MKNLTIGKPQPTPAYDLIQEDFSTSTGESLHHIALAMMLPLYRSTEVIMHTATPIRPGSFDNHSSYMIELVIRVFSVALVMVFLPLTMLAWGFSGLIDNLGDCLMQQSYMHLKGYSIPTLKSSCTIFSLNACMLWGMLPIPFGGVSPSHKRIDQLCDLILEQDADVVMMQEVSFDAAVALYGKLKDHYEHFYTKVASYPWLNLDSSLFVAINTPILGEPQVVPLPTSGTIKRVLFYVETEKAFILTTHLEAGRSDEDKVMRSKQLSIILSTIEQLKEKSGKPCIIAGDFNMLRTGDEDDEYTAQLLDHFYDAYKESTTLDTTVATCTNRLTAARMGWENVADTEELIDYALVDVASKDNVNISTSLVATYELDDPDKALSDHRALRTQIDFVV
ncbi:MAG: endonuclease/exonuclease/phosphatase family protein [Chlamydiales bacterium]|nr:endonuclease/exonuclease/phosphatase family protein [Chlamydiales bacterium]